VVPHVTGEPETWESDSTKGHMAIKN
jgi:hypothetical protein